MGNGTHWLAWSIMLFAGLSMITNLAFYSGKDFNLKRSVPFVVIVLIALGFSLISLDPPIVLFLLFLGYGLSGYLLWLKRRYFRKRPESTSPNE
jgi:CDP-diacylglycerol---serine O-phosphatidyltransferase